MPFEITRQEVHQWLCEHTNARWVRWVNHTHSSYIGIDSQAAAAQLRDYFDSHDVLVNQSTLSFKRDMDEEEKGWDGRNVDVNHVVYSKEYDYPGGASPFHTILRRKKDGDYGATVEKKTWLRD